MITLNRRIGRIVEITFDGQVTESEADALSDGIRTLAGSMPRMILVADCSGLSVMSGAVADSVERALRTKGAGFEKAGYLLPHSAVAAMQLVRVIRETAAQQAKSFRTGPELSAWMEPLRADERAVVQSFVSKAVPSPTTRSPHGLDDSERRAPPADVPR